MQADTSTEEAATLANAKAAVDEAIAQNGFVIFYAHSYNDLTWSYTLRPDVFEPLLDYIKDYVDDYELLVNMTTSELLNYYLTNRISD